MHYLQEELYELFRTDTSIFDFLQKSSLDGIWYWDLENPEHEWMSPRFWELFGVDPCTVEHRADSWQDMIHPDDLVTALSNFEAHLADPTHPYDQIVRYRHQKTLEWVTVRCAGIAVRDATGKPIRMLGAHTDLSPLKATEAALRMANQELLNAQERAKAALRAKTVFLETMSHEIRTPMNGILGMSEAIRNTGLDPQQIRMVDVINSSARSLLLLLNDVLDLSRIESGRTSLELAQFTPASVIEDVVLLFQPKSEEINVRLSYAVDDTLHQDYIGSSRFVRQVLTNLVSNATKYAANGNVLVKGKIFDPDGVVPVLELQVIDDGPGIHDIEKQRIFERFIQVAGDEGKQHGVGLGLSIATRLCDAHGGALDVMDTPGGGATFVARFALRKAQQHVRPNPAAIVRNKPRRVPRLLVVDDSEMNLMVMEAMVSPEQASLVLKQDPEEALRLAQQEEFDGAIVDIRMPNMNGLEFAAALRGWEATQSRTRIPLVACSANVISHQVEEYLASGFDAHLPKPIEMNKLESIVDWINSQPHDPASRAAE